MNEQQLVQLFKMQLPIKDGEWWDGRPREYSNLKQWRPDFSQKFGGNKKMYEQFGMIGHNGLDFSFKKGCPIVAPCKLWVNRIANSDRGYGFHVWTETETKTLNGDSVKLEIPFGHFDRIIAEPYKWYEAGDILGYGDSTGYSTGHHLHFGTRPLIRTNKGDFEQIFMGNGYLGYIDPEPFLPKIIWDLAEIQSDKNNKLLDKFMQDNEKKVVIEGDGKGRKGIIIDGKIHEVKKGREGAAALYVMANHGLGQTISEELFNGIEKEKDF